MGFEHTDTSNHAQYKFFEMHYMYATITLEEHLNTNAQQAFRGEVCEDATHPPPPPLLMDIDPPYRTFPFSPALGKGHLTHMRRASRPIALINDNFEVTSVCQDRIVEFLRCLFLQLLQQIVTFSVSLVW